MKIVVLSSGGLDSSLLMLLMKREGYDVYPLHVNYGHLAEEREWEACQKISKHLGLIEPFRMDMAGMGLIPCGLTNGNLDINKYSFLPTRNLLFTVLGAAYAYTISSNIAIGILANPIFPDQTPEFVAMAQSCISTALGRKIKVIAPLIALDKREIIILSKKHFLPFEIIYYCHSGENQPCGICVSCKERKSAEEYLRER
jgi:7-cyano-7-deazaguanine synthase